MSLLEFARSKITIIASLATAHGFHSLAYRKIVLSPQAPVYFMVLLSSWDPYAHTDTHIIYTYK